MIFPNGYYGIEGMRTEVMEKKRRPRKLNFNAPLLSTRRPAAHQYHISDKASCGGWKDPCNGIPFCWEQAPGKPKNLERINKAELLDAETPRPKPPPCRWRPPDHHHHHHQASSIHDNYHHDEGCDGDVDDYYDIDDGVFSDAVEVLSLTEAIDIVEKAEKFGGISSSEGEGSKSKSLEGSDRDHDHLDGLNLESMEQSPSPNFIIERFLPDATALAASSVVNMSKAAAAASARLPYLCNNYNYSDELSPHLPCVSQAVTKRSSFSSNSLKGCGLEMLLPWRMNSKHKLKSKLCGTVKTPIKGSHSIVQPTTSAKLNNTNKIFSSIVAPSGSEWRCK